MNLLENKSNVFFEGRFCIKFIPAKWKSTLVGYLMFILLFCFLLVVSEDLLNLVLKMVYYNIFLLTIFFLGSFLLIYLINVLVVSINRNVLLKFYVEDGYLLIRRGRTVIKRLLLPVHVKYGDPEKVTKIKILEPKKVLIISSKSEKLIISEEVRSDLLRIYLGFSDKADMYAIENGTLDKMKSILEDYLSN